MSKAPSKARSEPIPTLCFPGGRRNCFACCPPIRPAGYEHIQYRSMIQRMLRENTRVFSVKGSERDIVPITGLSCWALGYLDEHGLLAGCMLHPGQNNGTDYRFRVDYGEKCRREICPEGRVFAELAAEDRTFWFRLTEDLDSFAYSSRKANPLFSLAGWGARVLGLVAAAERGKILDRESLYTGYPFLSAPLNARVNAYLLNTAVAKGGIDLLKKDSFKNRFMDLSTRLSGEIRDAASSGPGAPFVHLLGLDPQFQDFLRLSAGINRLDRKEAMRLKEITDSAVDSSLKGLGLRHTGRLRHVVGRDTEKQDGHLTGGRND